MRWPNQIIERRFKRPSPHDAIVATCRQRGALASDDTENAKWNYCAFAWKQGFFELPEFRRVVPIRSNDLQMQIRAIREGGAVLDRREFSRFACSYCKKYSQSRFTRMRIQSAGSGLRRDSRVSVGPGPVRNIAYPGGAPKLWRTFPSLGVMSCMAKKMACRVRSSFQALVTLQRELALIDCFLCSFGPTFSA